MVLNCQKRFLAGVLVALFSCAAFAQTRVDFSLHSIDGQTVTSESLRGEVVVLAFGASWLPLSKTQLQGVRKLAIAAPGFSADCLETLEELGIRGRDQFLGAGGTHFARLDCLNDGDEGMAILDALIRRELA